jgi:hypothetical protein
MIEKIGKGYEIVCFGYGLSTNLVKVIKPLLVTVSIAFNEES